MKASEVIREARAIGFERGLGHGEIVDDEGTPCLIGLLGIAAGLIDDQRGNECTFVYGEVHEPGPFRDAIRFTASEVRKVRPSQADDIDTVWLWNDNAAHKEPEGHFTQALDILERAEKRALIAEEAGE